MENLARKYLSDNNKTENDYYMWCADLCDEILQNGDFCVHVEGEVDRDHDWAWHQVMMRDGLIHDAWHPNQLEATPIDQWLVDMFGEDARVTVAINGDDVFSGQCQYFKLADAQPLPENVCFESALISQGVSADLMTYCTSGV